MTDYPILVLWTNEDDEYVAVVPDLCGCSATGATPEEAVGEVQTAKRLWLEAVRDNGFPIPAPTVYPELASAGAAGVLR